MSWLSLYRKELRLTKTKFLINIGFLSALAILLYILMERYSPFLITLLVPVVLAHLFYMFFAMIDTLRQEWKQKTTVFWLNIPKSGWMLLTAKFVAAATQLLVSLSLTMVILYAFLQQQRKNLLIDPAVMNFITEQFQTYWWILFFGILIASLQGGAIATFIYMTAKSVRKLGWLLGIGIVVAAGWLWLKFQGTAMYQAITEWGVIMSGKTLMESLSFHFDSLSNDPDIQMAVTNNVVLYAGTAVVDLLIVIIVLAISSWLLDQKVEA